jgi:hypothetical protein
MMVCVCWQRSCWRCDCSDNNWSLEASISRCFVNRTMPLYLISKTTSLNETIGKLRQRHGKKISTGSDSTWSWKTIQKDSYWANGVLLYLEPLIPVTPAAWFYMRIWGRYKCLRITRIMTYLYSITLSCIYFDKVFGLVLLKILSRGRINICVLQKWK